LDEIDFILNNNGSESVAQIREELQSSMSENAGVFRNRESLEKQIEILKSLRERFKNIRIDDRSAVHNTDLQEAIELGHMLDYSMFIVKGALAREESRGAHFREDFPKRDDERFLKHTLAYMDENGDVSIEYMDVTLGDIEVKERVY
jgi:succinate dehydrogenase / fumarate reductase flavoprotein subunit